MSGGTIQDSKSITWQSHHQGEDPPDLRFLHFNDVYHIEYVESIGLCHDSYTDQMKELVQRSQLAG